MMSTTSASSSSSSSSSSSTTMKTDASVASKIYTPTPTIIGGDYAGLHATFSSDAGELVPIPHHFVPRSMIEWGDIPNSFDTLVSEDLFSSCTDNDDDDGRKGGIWSLSRTILTVMPEVGCGIDNLEITKKADNITSTSICRLKTWKVMTNDIPKEQRQQREITIIDRVSDDRETVLELETIFQLDDNSPQKNDGDGQVMEDDSISSLGPRRVRVSLSLTFPKEKEEEKKEQHCDDDIKISKLIDLHIERRISNTVQSTKGTIWTGPAYNSGGLDARTVYRAIGNEIKNGDVFAVKKGRTRSGDNGDDKFYPWTVPAGHHLGGIWNQTILSPPHLPLSVFGDDTTTCVEVLRSENEFMFGKSSTTPSIVTLRLPQNIMIRYGNGISLPVNNTRTRPERHTTCGWTIEISHISTIIREGKSYLHRTVALRSFNNTTTRRKQQFMKDEEERNVLGDIICWVEAKEGTLF